MALSRSKTKELIFDILAEYFEANGVTTCVTVADVIEMTSDREKRVQSLFDELVKENVIEMREEAGCYHMTSMSYMQLCMVLESMGRLPDGVEIDSDLPDEF